MIAQVTTLDPCCGSRMMWFDPQNPTAIFGDIRTETHKLCDGRVLNIAPDVSMDFRDLPFADSTFKLVVFDPPHLFKLGRKSWLGLKYGILGQDWKVDIKKGFLECFRVLQPHGILVFKWNENQIKVSEILGLTDQKPLFGHKSGKRSDTHWILFMKMEVSA